MAGSSIKSDHGIKLDVRHTDTTRPIHRLKVDNPAASFRKKGDGSTSSMCDFVALWSEESHGFVAAFEMKSGSIARKAVEQLQAGFDLVRSVHGHGDCHLRPHGAYLVGGSPDIWVKKWLVVQNPKVRFGSVEVRVEKLGSGTVLTVA